jgi:exonuclease SbcC
LEKKTGIEKELGTLEEQEQHFIQFKTFLANTKIEALSKITNEFLENIGSDIRIRFSGYTVLKTGKVREKISVSLIRAGLDQGSFGKFSAGEAARVNLATILSMQKRINSTCDTDKGLDLLVLDEILEAVDEEGLSHMFEALNRIGVTALVVSHGNIAEGYKHKLKIIKENGESKIEQ